MSSPSSSTSSAGLSKEVLSERYLRFRRAHEERGILFVENNFEPSHIILFEAVVSVDGGPFTSVATRMYDLEIEQFEQVAHVEEFEMKIKKTTPVGHDRVVYEMCVAILPERKIVVATNKSTAELVVKTKIASQPQLVRLLRMYVHVVTGKKESEKQASDWLTSVLRPKDWIPRVEYVDLECTNDKQQHHTDRIVMDDRLTQKLESMWNAWWSAKSK
jgi:hypothetical protein